MLATLEGLDHVVVMVQDLDAAAQGWRALGFTLSPRGTHSAHLGTGNYTLMFEDDYIELLGILTATDLNVGSRDFLRRREAGLERLAFRTSDAGTGVRALEARQVAVRGPIHFSRPVTLPDGSSSEAAFSIFHWPDALRPADVGLFACQHRTRETVWVPELVRHANTVRGIDRVEIIARDPASAASALADALDTAAQAGSSPGEQRIVTGPGHADLVFMPRDAFLARHGLADTAGVPPEGAAALVFRVGDLRAAEKCLGVAPRPEDGTLVVPPARANGVVLVFQAA